MANGMSKTMFIAGIVIAILGATAISTAISMNYAMGPKGDTGATGETGPQGEQGPPGMFLPDFDSGWYTIPDTGSGADILLITHNLGTQNISVYMFGKDQWGFTHQGHIGGYVDFAGRDVGAYWLAFNETTIQVYRRPDDQAWGSPKWVQVRLLVWKLQD